MKLITQYFLSLLFIIGFFGCNSSVKLNYNIDLQILWIKMGDDHGTLDTEDNIPNSVESAEFSPDEKYIASVAKGDNSIRLWNSEKGEELWKKYADDETECISFTRDSKYIVTGGEDKLLRIWNLDGEVVNSLSHIASIEGLRFSHNGKFLATGNEAGEINIWATENSDPTKWPDKPVYTLIHGNDQHSLNGKPEYGDSDINQIDWTEDDRFIISASRNTTLKLWEFDSLSNSEQGLKHVYIGHHGSSKCVRLSPSDSLVASGCGHRGEHDSGFGLWNTFSGELITYVFLPKMRVLETIEFTPNGKFLLIGGTEYEKITDGRISVYRVEELLSDIKEPFKIFDIHHQEYFYFSKDGSKLVSSHQDGSLRLWEVNYPN